MSPFIPLLLVLALFADTSIGDVTPLSYWKHVLPHTSMPEALHSLLPEGDNSEPHYGSNWVEISKQTDQCLPYEYRVHACIPPKGLFFFEEHLKDGASMDIRFLEVDVDSEKKPAFLPRHAAEAFPFSTSSFTTILRRFSLSPSSAEASAIKETLQRCEAPPIKGETSFCATSLESMVDYATTQLGTNNPHVLSSLVHKTKRRLDRSYVVQPGIVKMDSLAAVACHTVPYPYAVFYCHKATNTRSYVVPLMAVEDGSRVDAVAVCHVDTSQWDPEHPSFKVLGVKPGTVPICHFIPLNNVLWVSK